MSQLEHGMRANDPLDGLVERAADKRGAPFEPEVLVRLIELKREDPAGFESLRFELKSAGVRVTSLDRVISEKSGEEHKPTQADIIVNLASRAELFHTPNNIAYADLKIHGHRETWPVNSKGFRNYLTKIYFEKREGAPGSEALKSALRVLEAMALYDGVERDVHIRTAELDGKIYIDLADPSWAVIEIDSNGWRHLNVAPVRFRRSPGMLPLAKPVTGGSIDELRPFVNLGSDDDFVLMVFWLLASFRGKGPYPVGVILGEQGSAKSTLVLILRSLIDPNTAPLRSLSRDDRDLFIAASNIHLLAFDNLSGLPAWLSDTLCRLSTGGGFATRELFADSDETIFNASRPIILNGISEFITRPDLADRSIFFNLKPISEECRKSEKELWDAFEIVRPKIFGALLDAVSRGLERYPEISLERLPRMADFALWATACETAFRPSGTFIVAYERNRSEAVDNTIEGDPVASAVKTLAVVQSRWSGNASELLAELSDLVDEPVRRSKSWPGTPRAFSGRLRRAATFLRMSGVDIKFGEREGKDRKRMIHILSGGQKGVEQPSATVRYDGSSKEGI